jgi:hypothetical protein
MSLESSDIFGAVGSSFVVEIDSGAIIQATLGGIHLNVGADERSVTVPSLPAGDSHIDLAVAFGPGDTDANIAVSGATLNRPKQLSNRFPATTISLFGGETLTPPKTCIRGHSIPTGASACPFGHPAQ